MKAVVPASELPSKQRQALQRARRAAVQVIQRRFRLLRLIRDAYAKLSTRSSALDRVRDDLRTILRLAQAWARREYRAIPWKSLVYAVAAVIYFVNPVDVIPDVLVGIGFIDDAAVIGAVIRSIHNDLVAFQQWEAEGGR